MGSLGRAIYTVRFWIRETGQALDRLGCHLQGNYYFQEQRIYEYLHPTSLGAKEQGQEGETLFFVGDVVKQHWGTYGRNFFSRYDYEECESEGANKMIAYLRELISTSKTGDKYGSYILKFADDFSYVDPVDGSVASKQGVRFVFTDGSRIVFRLSGTGSAGATVRVYIEQFDSDASKHDVDAQIALKPLIDLALSLSKLKEFTGREKPTVIT